MSGKQDKKIPSVPDEGAVSEEEKCALDSGFISGELRSEEKITEELPQIEQPQENYMRLDSGVDLSESFSGLHIKNPDWNDLSCAKSKVQEPPVETPTTAKDDLWKQYFQQDEDGDTFLHLAIAEGFVEVVLALIRKAPHPLFLDTPNDNAQTPIHLAAAKQNWLIVRWLVVAGAKPCPRNIRGDSPLHIAARNGDLRTCRAITDPVQEQERISLGLTYPKQPYQEINLDQWNYEGQTCVHVAAIEGHIDVLRHLVWYGADINAREGRQGYTALHYSIVRGDERLAHFLLSECTKLNADAVTYGGNSALQLGFPVPATIAEALRSRGASSPFSTASEDEYSDSETESNAYENAIFVRNLVDASA
ncbi:cactus isoform 2 [Tribolium castaneum]|uniref:Cactus n=1 Tax=Tribolium castaneum TaxID=7070 RepID=A0A139W9N3_TRICA|nr:cactus isoform 2 [Tribolium castaneum]KYB24623.1 cactus [Tribolium castaneum]|eukprot:NP_001157182.1 cactus isoform 2 [Tribolium castaneum]